MMSQFQHFFKTFLKALLLVSLSLEVLKQQDIQIDGIFFLKQA